MCAAGLAVIGAGCGPAGSATTPSPVSGQNTYTYKYGGNRLDEISNKVQCTTAACSGSVTFKLQPGGIKFSDGTPVDGGLFNSDFSLCLMAPCKPGGALIFYGPGTLVPYPGAAGIPYSFNLTAFDNDNADESQSATNPLGINLCRLPTPGALCGFVLQPDLFEDFSCNDNGAKPCIEIKLQPGGSSAGSARRRVVSRATVSGPSLLPLWTDGHPRLSRGHDLRAVIANLRLWLAVAVPRVTVNLAVRAPVAA